MVSYMNKHNEHSKVEKNKLFKNKKDRRKNKSLKSKEELINNETFTNLSLSNIERETSIEDVEEESESVDSGCVPDSITNISDTVDWAQETEAIKNEYNYIKSFLQHMPWYDTINQNGEPGGSNEKSTPLYKTPEFIERQMKLAAEDKKDKQQQKSDSKKQRREKKEANKKATKGPGNCGSESIMRDDGVDNGGDEDDDDESMPSSQLTRMLPMHERRAKVEAQLKELKANKGSLPAYKWVKLIPKLQRKLGGIIKKEQKEKKKMKNTSRPEIKPQREKRATTPKKEKKEKKAKIYNQSGDLVFNKFDFTSAGDSVTRSEKDKPKNLQKIMSTIIKEKQKIETLSKNSRVEEASNRMEGGLWDNALKRAGGEKVKDDPNRIKKTMKNKANKKKASAVRWNEHEKMITKLAKDREDKKKRNVQKRKESSKKSKGGSKGSKGKGKKGAPGF